MRKDLILIAVIVATLALMVIPLNTMVIDALLALNISLSVLMLMVAVYLRHPSDFSTFPSVILLATAFRLSLSVGTTRLILSEADAGDIIATFGAFVVAGSVVIGLVIFLIITVVQFLVVTKGAERVAEVGARFALDAMPGKQMSIDAEVRAGNLTPEEATVQRKRLDKDSQFFGAMDGAMKFVKGDAIAGIIIICINLLGGVAVGTTLHGYSFGEAVGIFALLTVGDGLVAQIPALLMALCAGVVVTRVANQDNSDLGSDISAELVSDPRVPSVAAVIVLGIGVVPGFPTAIFGGLAVVLMVTAFGLRRKLARTAAAVADAAAQAARVRAAPQVTQPPAPNARFALRIAPKAAGHLDLDQIRRGLADHFGGLHRTGGVLFPTPDLRVCELENGLDVVIDLDDVPVFRTSLPGPGLRLRPDPAVQSGAPSAASHRVLLSPVLSGHWVDGAGPDTGDNAATISTEQALVTLTCGYFRHHLGTLFSWDVFQGALAEAKAAEPATMALIDEDMTEAAMFKMFRYLIEDGVPLRPLSLLVSAWHFWINTADQPSAIVLADCLRGSMRRQMCHQIAAGDGVIGLVLLDPDLEQLARQNIADTRKPSGQAVNDGLVFSTEVTEVILRQIRGITDTTLQGPRQVVLIASVDLRRRLRNFLAANGMYPMVLAPNELSDDVVSVPLGVIGLQPAGVRGPRSVAA